jgi:hypothetical protein
VRCVGGEGRESDYLIKGNTLIDPPKLGFTAELDPPTNNYCSFRRIAIVGNQIIRTKSAGRGILIGTPDTASQLSAMSLKTLPSRTT